MRERGAEAAALLSTMLSGTALATQIRKIPLLVAPIAQGTDSGPLRALQVRATERAARAGLHRISVVGGFAYSDVSRAGMSVLAIHDQAHAEVAEEVLTETVSDIEAHAQDFAVVRDDPTAAVRRVRAATNHPVILVDVADNIGGSSPSDGTALLSELLTQGFPGAVVPLVDPQVARQAEELGQGAQLEAMVGGRADCWHGRPVHVRGRVESVSDGRYRTSGPWMTGREFSMGTTAAIEVSGLRLLVMSERTPAFHAEQFTSQGINPSRTTAIVVKGAIAWRAALGDSAGEVAGPGITPVDVHTLPRAPRLKPTDQLTGAQSLRRVQSLKLAF